MLLMVCACLSAAHIDERHERHGGERMNSGMRSRMSSTMSSNLALTAPLKSISFSASLRGMADIGSYSITSSARPDKGSGTATPSARAVFRFICRSNLVAC